MWRRRRKRGAPLPRQLALGLLEDAMGRVEQRPSGEPGEAAPYPGVMPPRAAPAKPAGLPLPEDVPVDCSGGPPAGEQTWPTPRQPPPSAPGKARGTVR
jgi:hypothetical protein